MIKIGEYSRTSVIKAIADNPTEQVVGVRDEFLPYFDFDTINSIIGKEFLVQRKYDGRIIRTLFRLEGFVIMRSYRLENVQGNGLFEDTLNKSGRFCDSMQVVDRARNGLPIFAYEREKIFKTLEDATKKSRVGENWVRLLAVQFFDNERDFGKGEAEGCWENPTASKSSKKILEAV